MIERKMNRLRFFMALTLAWAALGFSPPGHASEALETLYEETARQLGAEAHQRFQQKLLQLLDSYPYQMDPSGRLIEYLSNDPSRCRFTKNVGVVFSTALDTEKNPVNTPSAAGTSITHRACGSVVLQETLQVHGKGATPLSFLQAVTGLRPYSLSKDQSYFQYEIRAASSNQTLYTILDRRLPSGDRQYVFFLGSAPIFMMNLSAEGLFIEQRGFLIDWLIEGERFRRHEHFPAQRFQVTETKIGTLDVWSMAGMQLVEEDGGSHSFQRQPFTQIPLNTLRFSVSHLTIESLQGSIGQLWQGFDQFAFPRSEFLQAGGAGNRLKNEIIRLIQRLQTGQGQIVIQELTALIEAIDKGLVRDNRP
jgi:hypothetical protein